VTELIWSPPVGRRERARLARAVVKACDRLLARRHHWPRWVRVIHDGRRVLKVEAVR
jgi:hypothetical protein